MQYFYFDKERIIYLFFVILLKDFIISRWQYNLIIIILINIHCILRQSTTKNVIVFFAINSTFCFQRKSISITI